MLNNKSILITGGAGFIGSHLADALLEIENDVIVLDNFSTGRPQNLEHIREKIQLVECDISQRSKWQNLFKNVDWVFHLASLADIVPSIEKPDEYYQSNVNGTFNVLEACRKHDVKKLSILHHHPVTEYRMNIPLKRQQISDPNTLMR